MYFTLTVYSITVKRDNSRPSLLIRDTRWRKRRISMHKLCLDIVAEDHTKNSNTINSQAEDTTTYLVADDFAMPIYPWLSWIVLQRKNQAGYQSPSCRPRLLVSPLFHSPFLALRF